MPRTAAANQRVDSSEDSMKKLSDDIGTMAERIGQMADRIGTMADRILETQKIQSENMKQTQEAALEMMRIMNDQLKANHELIKVLAQRVDNPL